jgi:hypothetical protein
MTDPRPPLDAVHGTFKAAAPTSYVPPGGSPVAADVARLPRPPMESTSRDGSIVVKYERNVFSLRRDQVANPTRGGLIIAEGQTWMIEDFESQDDELVEVAVIRMPS